MPYSMRKFSTSEDFVRCEICGEEFTQISWNHLRKHNTSTREYMTHFKLSRGQLLSRPTRLLRQEIALRLHRNKVLNGKYITANRDGSRLKNARAVLAYTGINKLVCGKMWEGTTPEQRSKILSVRATKREAMKRMRRAL